MAVTREDVLMVARLARLALDPEELDRMTDQLNGILTHIEELRELSLEDVPPFEVAAEGAAPLRSDGPGADTLLHEPGSFAAEWRGGFFTVPRLAAQRGLDAEAG